MAVALPRSPMARGHTLISALVALFIVSSVSAFLMQGLATMMKANRATQQRTIASCLLDSEMERLRSLPTRNIRLTNERPLVVEGIAALPNSRMTLTIEKTPLLNLKKVTVQLRWHEAGGPQRQARLVTLIGERNG